MQNKKYSSHGLSQYEDILHVIKLLCEITELYMCKFCFMLPSLMCIYNRAGSPEDLEHSCVIVCLFVFGATAPSGPWPPR